MSKVLYISYDGMTDALGESQVIPYLVGLSHLGHQISIISAEKPKNFEKRSQAIAELLKEHSIEWFPVKYNSKPPVISTLLDFWTIKRKARLLHKSKSFSIVHCRSYIPAIIGMYLKKKYGVKFIFDMRGFWADERIEGGIWSKKNLVYRFIYKYFKTTEKKLFSNADFTISLTHEGEKIIHSWDFIKHQPIKIQVIPCCTNFELFDYNKINDEDILTYRNKLKIEPESIVVSYLGSIGTWYMMDEMFNFFNHLLNKHPHSVFLFITRDPKELLNKYIDKYNIPKEKLVVYSAERKEIPTLLSLSTVSLFFIKPVFSKKASSPTKHGEIMGLGIPIICNTGVGDIDFIVKSTNTGFVMNDFSENTYHEAINSIENLIKVPKQDIAGQGRHFYNLEDGIKKIHDIYLSLIQN